MEPKTRSKVSSDRQNWGKIFRRLVKLLKDQQEQLETLVGEQKILEDRFNVQNERWVSEIKLYEDHIAQLKDDFLGKEKECYLESAKSDFFGGLNQKVVSLNKLKLEQTKDELADFKAWLDYHSDSLKKKSKECDTEKEGERLSNSKSARAKMLQGEVKRLKHECEKLASEKSSKISRLERENAFLWNQYNVLQRNLTEKLESKQSEVEQSNEKIAEILAREQILQSSNNEKDAIIGRLATKLGEMEADSNNWKAENSKLSQELELLRKCKNSQVTPVLRDCNAGTRKSSMRVRSSSRDRSNVVVKKELPDRQAIDQSKDAGKENTGNSKRQGRVDVITASEIPRLFSSSFKVPKLKTSSTDM